MSRKTTIPSFALALLCLFGPDAAFAYVREVTSTGIPVSWRNPSVTMHFCLGDPPPMLTADQFMQAATTGASVWSAPDLACSNVHLAMVAEAATIADVAFDKINNISFRTQAWCGPAVPPASPDDPSCYAHSALAVTTLFKNKNTGELLDADIAVNAVDFVWGDLVAMPDQAAGGAVDFQNMLTHELGHVLGLDHPCYSPADGQGRLLDNTGSPELDCTSSSLPQAIADSTMFPSVSLKDTSRRDLEADDIQGICDIYPAARGGGGGCAIAPDRRAVVRAFPAAAVVVLSAILFALLYRRRRI